MIRVLWVEDTARTDLPSWAAPVYMAGEYDLIVAEDITSAIYQIKRNEFDVVIIDIRIFPGDDPNWERLFKKKSYDLVKARIGLEFLYTILDNPRAKIKLNAPLTWLTPDKIGVLTVEGIEGLLDELRALGIVFFTEKRADLTDTILLDIITKILKR
jgi:ABC-type Fe3+-hydroxamate transport system substrate-binding protein